MNRKQIVIAVIGLVLIAFIVWQDLPIEFPLLVFKFFKLTLKVFAVLFLTGIAYILAGKKNPQQK